MHSVRRRFLLPALVLLSLLVLGQGAWAQVDPPSNYYDPALGLTGSALKSALKNIIDGHTMIPYTASSTDTWDALKVLDQDPGNSARILLEYSGLSALKSDQNTGDANGWNREHLWPLSYGLEERSGNSRAKTDLFHLRPADVTVNSTRGNLYFDVTTLPGSSHPESPASTYDSNSWEPRDVEKGDIARAAFYMAVRYDGSDSDVPDIELSDTPNEGLFRFGKLSTLLAWNRQFPPTTVERTRNQRIYADYQHNRNPFIDRPDYADMVFLGVTAFQAWKNGRFTSAELANTSISGDLANPDKDTLPNLLEYTLNRNAKLPESTPALSVSRTVIGSAQFVDLVFVRNRHASDVTVSFEGSATMQSWAPVTANVIVSTVLSYTAEERTVRIAAPAGPYFVRMKVVR